MNKYRLIRKLGEGTFSEVLKAQSVKSGKYVAIKCMKNHFDSIEQVKKLREIQALERLSPHAHIIKLLEVLYDGPTGRLALVFELMEMNMYEAIKGRPHYLPENRVKFYIYQLMKAIDHMHRNGIFHRDIKPENILLLDDTVKLADFGSCRGIYSKPPLTEYISTRWYRAPEWLLTDGYYGYKMDIWGVGWVFFEVLSLFPLFPGDNELDQIHKIHNILGTPEQELLDRFQKHATHMEFDFPTKKYVGISRLISHVSKECQELILWMITYNPDDRPSASQIIKHPYFKDLKEIDDNRRSGQVKGVGIDNLSQYSRRNRDNASDGGDSQNSKSFKSSKKKFLKNPHQVNIFPPIKNIKGDKKKGKKKGHHGIHKDLKHNSSNHSITGKKIIPTVKKIKEFKIRNKLG